MMVNVYEQKKKIKKENFTTERSDWKICVYMYIYIHPQLAAYLSFSSLLSICITSPIIEPTGFHVL